MYTGFIHARRPVAKACPVCYHRSAAQRRKQALIRGAHMALQQVIWDWNGTLLNDLDYAIGVRNRVFPAFGLPCISKPEEYQEQFTFPVRLYYERAGVTDENFDAVAHAWMDEYVRGCASVPLHPDALDTLKRLRAAGVKQVILTASPQPVILEQLSYYPLEGYFDEVLGLGDIYARSKEAVGCAYLERCGVEPDKTVMIGDTLHDAEVAKAMGTRCILVSRGHHTARMLHTAGVDVADSLAQAADWVLARDGR